MRDEDNDVVLWLDAICINQEDVTERGHQISMMGEIYRSASRVHIWLGHAADGSDSLIDKMDFYGEIKSNEIFDWTGNIDGKGITESQRSQIISGISKAIHFPWPSFQSFVNRPWWTRVWVVQELASSRTDPIFICGEKTMTYASLRRFDKVLMMDEKGFDRTGILAQRRQTAERRNVYTSEFHGKPNAMRAMLSIRDLDYKESAYIMLGCPLQQRSRPDTGMTLYNMLSI